ncbi:MAG: hypothetical protein COB33_000965 [Thiotrichaceae bacterium]|nr:hypothetical protein [Thiotrichaceae bacterium]
MNIFIKLAIIIFALTGCKNNDSPNTGKSLIIDKPVIIPMVSYNRETSGLSGVWNSVCAMSHEIDGFQSANATYVISENHSIIKYIIRLFRTAECSGRKTTLTFVMSCKKIGESILESGITAQKVQCKKDRFWRETEQDGLLELDKTVDFKIVLFQQRENILYSGFSIDEPTYPNKIEWGLPYERRILPIGIDIGIL